MKGLNKLKGSRRFWIALFGFVTMVVAEFGLEISPEMFEAIEQLVLLLVASYTAQDVVVAYRRYPTPK